jgi:hypothetical protein
VKWEGSSRVTRTDMYPNARIRERAGQAAIDSYRTLVPKSAFQEHVQYLDKCDRDDPKDC